MITSFLALLKVTGMTKLTQYQVDAFATRIFEGNPAAVCPLEQWLDNELMQCIAAENNLSETAFVVPDGDGFALRWFTPLHEVDLCGHATLATAHILFTTFEYASARIRFSTRSGDLFVSRDGDMLAMDFPAAQLSACAISEQITTALGQAPLELWCCADYLAVFPSEADVRALQPDHTLLSGLDLRGVIATAPGEHHDFVSRFFAPKYGIPEDPVTGSAHCALAPYWSERLHKNPLQARQISKRGGDIACEVRGERVILRGRAVTVMRTEIFI